MDETIRKIIYNNCGIQDGATLVGYIEDILDRNNKAIEEKDKEIERLNSIINTILNFDFFKDECPLNFCYTEKCDEEEAQNVFYEDDYCEENCDDNNYKKCWLKYFKKLQELKGSGKE